MKKLALIAFALSYAATTTPISLKTNNILQELLEKFSSAYKDLKNVRKDIHVDTKTTYSYTGDGDYTTNIEYSYLFKNDHAEDVFLDYKGSFNQLGTQLDRNALSNGLIIGAAIACCNKILGSDISDEKAIVSTIAGALYMVAHQNNQMKRTPYYNLPDLEHGENLFSNTNILALSRATLALISSTASYFGTNYALGYISNYKK